MNNRKNEKAEVVDQMESSYFRIGRECKGPMALLAKGQDIPSNLSTLARNTMGCLKAHDDMVYLQRDKQAVLGKEGYIANGLFHLSKAASDAGKCDYVSANGKSDFFKTECKDVEEKLDAARSYAKTKLGM